MEEVAPTKAEHRFGKDLQADLLVLVSHLNKVFREIDNLKRAITARSLLLQPVMAVTVGKLNPGPADEQADGPSI